MAAAAAEEKKKSKRKIKTTVRKIALKYCCLNEVFRYAFALINFLEPKWVIPLKPQKFQRNFSIFYAKIVANDFFRDPIYSLKTLRRLY